MTEQLGEVLRRWRLDAAHSQRELADAMGIPDGTVALIERGERAPSNIYIERFLQIVPRSDEDQQRLWRLYREIPTLATRDGTRRHEVPPAPYRGLRAFREEDARYFFGRTTIIDRLLAKLGTTDLVGIVGASGSGKSSVVYAGLVPALRTRQSWQVVAFRPGSQPYASLAGALIGVLEPNLVEPQLSRAAIEMQDLLTRGGSLYLLTERITSSARPLLIFIDQFEELFTQCQDTTVRRAFVDLLLEVTGAHGSADWGNAKLLLTLRGDFYGQVIAYRPLSEALQDNVVNLPPMSRDELKSAIVEPARAKQVMFEAGLVERILDDVGEQPGNLPLLEFSLMLLWESQRSATLTHQMYDSLGRLAGAVARQAEEVYTSFAPEQQHAVRKVMTRLVHVARPGEEGDDARRSATFEEFAHLEKAVTAIRA